MGLVTVQCDIGRFQDHLESYIKELPNRAKLFCTELCGLGIEVGKAAAVGSEYSDYIVYEMNTNVVETGCKAIIIVSSSSPVIRQWLDKYGNVKQAEVNPLLMAEFGSGFKAVNLTKYPGVGQGTFPSKTAKTNAFKADGWWYKDLAGNWHNSKGEAPSMPVQTAYMQMFTNINRIASKYF